MSKFSNLSFLEQAKLGNAIAFFAGKHKEKTGKPLYQTYLYKYLALLDYELITHRGTPSFHLTYRAMDQGPVPEELYFEKKPFKTEWFEMSDELNEAFTAVKIETWIKPDLDNFNRKELQVMNKLLNLFATDYRKSKDASEHSHEVITAWQKAYARQRNSVIDDSENFEFKDGLSFPEEAFLFHRSLNELKAKAK